MRENVQFLRELLGKKQPKARVHHLDILDLLANAQRRAELACRYDDAVARLYSALESLARYQLQDEHGIANAEVPPEKVPEDVRAAYIEHYLDEEEGTLVLGLDASYRLLAALDDDLGKRYVNRYQDLRQVLNIRNQSRLAHGRNPVRPHVYQRLRDLIFDFADIEEADLPTFPILEL
jgi:CRISPR-associated protein (TIGR02710 family)